eukprot:1452183-Rhodomonas_salina.1
MHTATAVHPVCGSTTQKSSEICTLPSQQQHRQRLGTLHRVTPAMPHKLNSSSRAHRPQNRNRGWDAMRSQQQTPAPQDQTVRGEGG